MANGWQTVTLGKILKRVKKEIPIEDDVTYKQVTVRLWNKGVILRGEQQGSEIKTKRQFVVRSGQLVLSRIDVRNGAIGLCPPELDGAIVSNDFWAYDFDHNLIYPEFLSFYMKTPGFIDDANRTSSGTTKRIRSEEGAFLRIEIPLPPLTEQRRIVERIEALAGRIAEAQSLRREASEEAEVLVGREIAALFTNADGWRPFKLGDLTVEVCYGTSAKAHIEPDGVPVFRMGNIQNGKLDLVDMKYMYPNEQEMRKLRLQKGDILVNRTNSAELVGKCAVFDLERDYLFASYIIRIRLDQQKADPQLVAQYINSPIGRAYMFAERKQMTGQANVNSKKLAALPIQLPPLEEQRWLVRYLDGLQAQVSALREAQSATEKELSALMPSILDKAFKGEL